MAAALVEVSMAAALVEVSMAEAVFTANNTFKENLSARRFHWRARLFIVYFSVDASAHS
jgi:hypothetical protein